MDVPNIIAKIDTTSENKLKISEEIKEIHSILEKIVDYFNSNINFNEEVKEMGLFFVDQLKSNLDGAKILLDAVLDGKKESLKHSKNYANAAKNTIPHITSQLDKINNEEASSLKKDIERSFNSVGFLFPLSLRNCKLISKGH